MDPSKTHPYLRITCHGCPVQVEGATPEGHDIYFRFRHGVATFEVNGATFWSATLSDDLDGYMDSDMALRLAASLADLHAALEAILGSRTVVDKAALTAEMERFFKLPRSSTN